MGTSSASEIFAGNRASGSIALAVKAAAGISRRGCVHESGMLRVRFPHAERRGVLEAVIINSAGGLTGGDRASIDIGVAQGASATVTTASAEKIYRSLGPDTEMNVRLAVGCGSSLAWLPQETILFDRARLRRTISVALAPTARLLLAETLVLGRTAMGETPRAGLFYDRWRVRVAGALRYAETIRLDGAIADKMAERAIGGGARALGSVLVIPGDDQIAAAVRATRFAGDVAVSAWNGLALVRLLAADGARLRGDLIDACKALGAPAPRLWLN